MSDNKTPVISKPPAPAGPPAPKNPGLVTFTVDGKEVVAKPGTNLIEAAKQVGADIPYFCYHPALTVAANCRMCMVESSAAPPGKLVPACQTAIAEGIAIQTETDKVREQQKMVMEFLLLNHPVDCSICDQAGECKLQDYYMRHDGRPSRLRGFKVLRNKRKVLGETIVLDQERCILCTRCVRFMSEVARAPQLGVFGRGSHEVVDVAPEFGAIQSNYSGNIVDLCPVGALLSRDFRFRQRAWFLSSAPSVCTGCSRGCNTFADFMGQDVFRYRPRENEAINKSWMCDQGRISYKQLNTGRALKATVGRGAQAREAQSTEAVKYCAMKLKPLIGQVAFVASAVCSNEDLLAGFVFARDVLQLKSAYVSGRKAGESDFLLMQADKNPNRRGLESIAKAMGLTLSPFEQLAQDIDAGRVKALVALGHEVPEAEDDWAARCGRLEFFAMSQSRLSKATQAADVSFPAATHVEDEGSFTQADGATQRFRRAFPPRGEAQPHWRWMGQLAQELGHDVLASSAREVFKRFGSLVPELATYDWDKSAPASQLRPGIGAMAAAADGRPPGYREQGVPNVRGLTLLQR